MKTILVVADEFDMTSTLRDVLEGDGNRVPTCTDGRAAIECVPTSMPDLILRDEKWPVMSGLEVLRELRTNPALDGVPVALMSAVALGARREVHGRHAFLSNPFGLEELIRTVERVIGPAGPDRGEPAG
jgi:CheY-like chemotaxis protein